MHVTSLCRGLRASKQFLALLLQIDHLGNAQEVEYKKEQEPLSLIQLGCQPAGLVGPIHLPYGQQDNQGSHKTSAVAGDAETLSRRDLRG